MAELAINENDKTPVPGDSYVLRRIPPDRKFFDEHLQRVRPQSGNFDDDSDGDHCSVILSVALREQGREDIEVLDGHPDFYLVKISVEEIQKLGLIVERSKHDDEPAHGSIVGKKTGSIKGKLSKLAEWVVGPTP